MVIRSASRVRENSSERGFVGDGLENALRKKVARAISWNFSWIKKGGKKEEEKIRRDVCVKNENTNNYTATAKSVSKRLVSQ